MKNINVIEQRDDYDCGAASLAMALEYLLPLKGISKQPSYDDILKACETTPERGTSIDGMILGADYFGLLTEYRENCTWEDLLLGERGDIVIILNFWDSTDGHYSVLVGVNDFSVVIADPQYSLYRTISKDEWMRNWFDYDDRPLQKDNIHIRCMLILS